jgi:DNA-binding CsgD family transcriptional regulator
MSVKPDTFFNLLLMLNKKLGGVHINNILALFIQIVFIIHRDMTYLQ